MADADAGPVVDGRRARRDRNRELVLDAVLALFAEGHLNPSAPQVAARSGVSPRSVFRYYEDTEELVRAAIARHVELVAPLFALPGAGEGGLDDRIDQFVVARMRLYEAVAPTARAASMRVASNRIIADQFTRVRRQQRAQLAAMFAPELQARPVADRRAVLAAADTLCQFEAVEHLRVHLRLGPVQAAAALTTALRALLA